MSTATIVALLFVHLAFWIVQLVFNQVTGAATDCSDISAFACGSGVLEDLSSFSTSFRDINGILGVAGFLIDGLKTAFSVLLGLVFFDYQWTSGGGDVADLVMAAIRVVLASVLVSILIRAAINFRGGKII